MGLWSNLLATYAAVQDASGIIPHATDSRDGVLLPPNHTTLPAQICISLDSNGLLLNIERYASTIPIVIPCTEASMGRTGKNPHPHPLTDQLQYLDGNVNPTRHSEYLHQLADWKGDNTKLNAIYAYLSEHSIVEDSGRYLKTPLSPAKDARMGVRFRVEIAGDDIPYLDEDTELRDLWIARERQGRHRNGTDYLGGEFYAQATNFPKNILDTAANAKLISTNDKTNLTFRGRFRNRNEALYLDTDTSQAALSTLRWLVSNHSTKTDTQAIVFWSVGAPQSDIPNPTADSVTLFADDSLLSTLFGDESLQETDADRLQHAFIATSHNYALQFRKLLRGYGRPDAIQQHEQTIVVLILDTTTATAGRLSVTFYQELHRNEYIEKIAHWHSDSAWEFLVESNDSTITVIEAPSFNDIANCTYSGANRKSKDYKQSKDYKRHIKNVRQQLIECMFGNKTLPRVLLQSAFHKVSHPLSYDKVTHWDKDLRTTCSLWRKHYIDLSTIHSVTKEVTVELDSTRTDRDYLYGRLLALANDFEDSVLYQRGLKGTRPTNAIKLMSNFAAKPYDTWGNLWKQLTPYLKAASSREYFMNDIAEVTALFADGDYENNRPLSPLYLLGFFSQRRYDYQRRTTHETVNENN